MFLTVCLFLTCNRRLDGDISEAMAICNKWLHSPEETRLEEKVSLYY